MLSISNPSVKRNYALMNVHCHVMLLKLALFRLEEAVKLIKLILLIWIHVERNASDRSRTCNRRYFRSLHRCRSSNMMALMNFVLFSVCFRFLLAE